MNSLGRGALKRQNGVSQKRQVKKIVTGKKTKKKQRNGSAKNVRGSRSKRSMGATVTPARRTVELEYIQMFGVTVGAHQNWADYLLTNGAFAVDPAAAVGYATTPNFSVLAVNYAAYRVRKYRSEITFSSTFTSPIDTIVCHTNTNLGATAGGAPGVNLIQYAANRPKVNTIKPMAAGTGGRSQVTHIGTHTIASIVGESIQQPGYKSLTNTVPANLTYLVFGMQSTVNMTTVVDITMKLCLEVEFLDYIDTLASFRGVPISETDRLASFGKPAVLKPCAACTAVSLLEFAPCPDQKCKITDQCTNCGFWRGCSLNCQSPRCPWKAELISLREPTLIRVGSRKDVLAS